MTGLALSIVFVPIIIALVVWFFSAFILYKIGKKFNVGSFWEYCIPIYNMYLICKCADVPAWNCIGAFIPILHFYCIINIFGSVAEKLGKNYWLYGILSLVILGSLILAFDDSYPFEYEQFKKIAYGDSESFLDAREKASEEMGEPLNEKSDPESTESIVDSNETFNPEEQALRFTSKEIKTKKKWGSALSRLPIISSFTSKQLTELVGVDIGTTSIKVCCLKNVRGFFTVQNIAHKTYDQDLLSDGHIVDIGFLAEELKKIFDENRIRSRNVACAMSSYSVISKKILMPFLPEEEIESSISMEVESAIPFPLKDIYYSYYVMGADFEKQNMLNVKIVAAKKEIVDAYVAAFNMADLSLQILDVDVFDISNFVEQIYGPKEHSVVIVDIGASVTNIAILNGENIEFTRELIMGGKYLTNLIQKSTKLQYKIAEEKKLAADSNVAYLFEDFIFNISSEINKTVRFYLATKPKENIGKIYITGGSSLLPGLKEKIVEDTGIEAEVIDPFMLAQPGEIGTEAYESMKEFMVVPLYLSTRISDLI